MRQLSRSGEMPAKKSSELDGLTHENTGFFLLSVSDVDRRRDTIVVNGVTD